MELVQVMRVLLRRWYLVVIPVVIVAAVSIPQLLRQERTGTVGYTTVVRYTAAQSLEAMPDRDGDFQDVWLASELAVNALTEWLRTTGFADGVNALLAEQGITGTAGEAIDLRGRIATDNERSIGTIQISWMDAETLPTIVDAMLEVMQTRSAETFPQLGGAEASIRLLDEPVISAVPPGITDRLRPLLQIGLALLAGVALSFLADYLDPVVRRRDQIESLRLPVMTVIPKDG
jgi:capsular polysaccharide biosynthesis protein